MGKIFGLSDLPVETIGEVISPCRKSLVPKPVVTDVGRIIPQKPEGFYSTTALPQKISKPSNPVIKMRHGIGKLMSHFSKPQG